MSCTKEIRLEFRQHEDDEFQCEITDLCEDHLAFDPKCDKRSFMATYMCAKDRYYDKWLYSIRRPGATRGHVEVDDNDVIIDIVIYGDSGIDKHEPNNVGCYKHTITDALKVFIGSRLIHV